MRRRKLLWAAVVGLVALAGVAAFALWPRPDRVTTENFDRIHKGMTRGEVEAILGPPGDYTNGPTAAPASSYPVIYDPVRGMWLQGDEGSTVAEWRSDTGWLRVLFSVSGRVEDHWFQPQDRIEQSALDNLLWRAKRQWRRWSR